MTSDERLVLTTTVTLLGFELWERFMDDGVWRPVLLGKYLSAGFDGNPMHEAVTTQKQGAFDKVIATRMSFQLRQNCQRKHWLDLPDQVLQDFYNVVVSTC